MLEETNLQLMCTSSNDVRHRNMGTHHPSKEEASSSTNKDGKEYVFLSRCLTNIWVWEKTTVTDVIEKVSRIRDNRWTLCITTWKPYKRNRPRGRPARRWRDEQDDYWKGTIWERIAQDKQMWKQHAEAFAQPWDTTAAQWWWRWWIKASLVKVCFKFRIK